MKNYLPWILPILLLACRPSETHPVKLEGKTMGTFYHISFLSAESRSPSHAELQSAVDSLLMAFNQSVSTYIPASTISRANQSDSLMEVDAYFAKVFQSAREVSARTDGAFDVTVMPLVNAWGFGYADTTGVDSASIDSLRSLVDFRKVELMETDGKYILRKADPRIQLDFSAIAKGYGVDLICGLLEEKGISRYMVEIGGELRTKGKNARDESWQIGIDKPVDDPSGSDRELKAVLALENKAVATSGNYRNFYYRNGKKVSHEIDPKTGYPAGNNLLSAVVVAGDCMTADAYATAFMVMGLEKSLDFLEKDTTLGAYLIYADEAGEMKTVFTENVRGMVEE
jgi:thiamine biosynthesis lipoprotein